MANTRDHVTAYDYESRRRVTALLRGADQARQDPRRRLNRTLVGSTVIAVLAMAGVGVAGFLGGGRGPDLPDNGAVTVKGSGDRYVVVDGVVHPALNLPSALLVGGGELTEVRRDVLDGRPRGRPVGIAGVPDALPAPDRLSGGPWTVCLRPSRVQGVLPSVTVLVGLPAPAAGVLSGNLGVLATEQSGTLWLLAEGRRFRLVDRAREVPQFRRAAPTPVPPRVLDTIPEGPPIAVPQVASGGTPRVRLPVAAAVGDLVLTQVASQPGSYYLVREDGVLLVSPFTAVLLQAGGATVVRADTSEMADAPTAGGRVPGEPGWPDSVPTLAEPQRDQPLCVSTTPGQPAGDAPWQVTVSLPPQVPLPAGSRPVDSGGDPSLTIAVAVAPGAGALVLARSSGGQDGAFTLVTDTGQRFAVVSADAVSRLRYDPSAATAVPLPFVALLPAGPVLDPDAAAREVPAGQDQPR